jgi:hypothetical protein
MSNINLHKLQYIVNHIFLPPELPQKDDHNPENDRALCRELCQSACNFYGLLPSDGRTRWDPIIEMLQCLCDFHELDVLSKDCVKSAMERMQPGGMLSF